MKYFPFSTLSLLLLTAGTGFGSTVVAPGDPGAIPGQPASPDNFPYDNYYVFGSDHTATWTSDTDAYSWDHPNLQAMTPELTGWTHLTRWIAITTTSAVDLTIRIDRASGVRIQDPQDPLNMVDAGADLVPAFTLWSGFMANVVASGGHEWDNNGNDTPWMQGILTYLTSEGNAGNAGFVDVTVSLPAGNYTLNIGGSKDGPFDPGVVPGDLRKGYTATLTTVPEPSVTVLAALCGLGLVLRRRRPARS